MKIVRYILLSALCMSLSAHCFAQDNERLSERQVMGTARYVGMSGAMTAIGGDPSAVYDNPAGLGVYRRSEVLLSVDYQRDRTMQQNSDSLPGKSDLFMVPQVSLVIAIGNQDKQSGIISNNLMLSYHRLRTFNRYYKVFAPSDRSLGNLLSSANIDLMIPYPDDVYNTSSVMSLRESGYVNQYAFDWAMNISHRWYVGAGLRMYSYRMAADVDYYELFPIINQSGEWCDLENQNTFVLNGFGVGGSFGVIYRPCGWVRLGFALHTPTLGTVNCNASGTMSALTDSLRYSDAYMSDKWDYSAPLRTSLGVALQVGDYGALSLQYDYQHAKYCNDLHTLRAGLEIVPVPGLYLNAGYGYESTFKRSYDLARMDPKFERQDTHSIHPESTWYASGGIGYRGRMFMAQLAYQYRRQMLQLHAHEKAQPIDINADTHRIVLTLGWHN